jgi:hypothetical protein
MGNVRPVEPEPLLGFAEVTSDDLLEEFRC